MQAGLVGDEDNVHIWRFLHVGGGMLRVRKSDPKVLVAPVAVPAIGAIFSDLLLFTPQIVYPVLKLLDAAL